MRIIIIDCEGKGPAAAMNNDQKFELGAVDFTTFCEGDPQTFHMIGATPKSFNDMNRWLKSLGEGPYIFLTDNIAYDWQFPNHYFHLYLGHNPFGHSARRIGDFAAGFKAAMATHSLLGPKKELRQKRLDIFLAKQTWKKLRITKHDHNPVNDAMGNAEAFLRILDGEDAG